MRQSETMQWPVFSRRTGHCKSLAEFGNAVLILGLLRSLRWLDALYIQVLRELNSNAKHDSSCHLESHLQSTPHTRRDHGPRSAIFQQTVKLNSHLKIHITIQGLQFMYDHEKRATGVHVLSLGRNFTLSSKNEVSKSAGVMHATQLLMSSGIGDHSTLQHHKRPRDGRPGRRGREHARFL